MYLIVFFLVVLKIKHSTKVVKNKLFIYYCNKHVAIVILRGAYIWVGLVLEKIKNKLI